MTVSTTRIVVAIDGPAGAGKSTVSKRLAMALGYDLLDTGALYRAVALRSLRHGVDWDDEKVLAQLAGDLDIRFSFKDGKNHVYLGTDDVTEAIRSPEISSGASQVSVLPGVRTALMGLQRRLGAHGGVVAEGRDVGTVVFPGAQAKFFLTASEEIRAQRRFEELAAKGVKADLESTRAEMSERDSRDSDRDVAPLKQADDAVLVDSSGLSIDQVIDEMATVVRTREALPSRPKKDR